MSGDNEPVLEPRLQEFRKAGDALHLLGLDGTVRPLRKGIVEKERAADGDRLLAPWGADSFRVWRRAGFVRGSALRTLTEMVDEGRWAAVEKELTRGGEGFFGGAGVERTTHIEAREIAWPSKKTAPIRPSTRSCTLRTR